MRRILKLAAVAAAAVVAAALLALAGLYAFAQTEAGEARLAALAGRLLSGPGQQVKIGRVGFSRAFDRVTVRGLTLADAGGAWLEVADATIDWRPAALLEGRLEAERVAVAEAHLLRIPKYAGDEAQETGGEMPVAIGVAALDVARLRLDPAVLGRAAALSVTGGAQVKRNGEVETKLAAKPAEGGRANYALDLRWAPDGAGHLALDLRAEEGPDGLLAGLVGVPELAPRSLALKGEGPLDDWRGTLRASLPNAVTVDSVLRLAVREPLVVSVEGRAAYPAPEHALLRRLVASAARFDGEVALNADDVLELRRLRVESDRVAGSLTGRFDLARMAGAADFRMTAEHSPDLSGAVAARLELAANALTAEIGELRLKAPELEAALRAPATVTYRDGVASLARLDLGVAGARVTGAARYAPEGLTADLDVAGLALAEVRRLVPELPIAGEIDATLHAEGPLTAPAARVRLAVRDLRPVAPALAGAQPLSGTIAGRIGGGALSLDGALSAPAGADVRFDAKGPAELSAAPFAFSLSEDAAYTANLKLTGLALADLRAVAPGLPLEGRVGGEIHLSGPLARPDGRIAIEASGLHATVPALAGLPPLGGNIDGTLAEGRLSLTGELAAAAGPSLRVDLAGPLRFAAMPFAIDVPKDEPVTATLAARGLDLAQLRAAAPELALAGRAEGEVRLDGRLAAPAGTFKLTVAGLRTEAPGRAATPPLSGTVSGGLADGRLSATGKLAAPSGAALDLALGLPADLSLAPVAFSVRPDGEISGNLKLTGLPMQALAAVAPIPAGDGRLDADLRLSGTAARPEGALRLAAQGIRVSGSPAGIRPARVEAQGTLAGGTLALTGTVTGLSRTDVQLAARLPVEVALAPPAARVVPDRPVSGRLHWTGAVGPIVERLPVGPNRLDGNAEISATLAGTMSDPSISGRMSLSDGRYEHLVAGTLIQAIDLAAGFDGRRLVIERATGTDGGEGRVSARGAVAFGPGFAPDADLTVDLDDATVIRRDELVATVRGALTLEGGPADGLLAGQLETRRVEARLVADLPPSVVELPVEEAGGAPAAGEDAQGQAAGAGAGLRLEIAVAMPNSVFLRGRGLDSEWAGGLQVSGTAAEPRVKGSLRPLRGEFQAFGRAFALGEGSVQFAGGKEIDPALDLNAVHEQDGFKAIVHVGGTGSRPVFELASEPRLPRDEIIARILFGKQPGALSPFEALQVADTAATLSGKGSTGGILDRARRFIGVDTLRVEGGEGGAGDVGVSVGKRIADDVYVDVSQGNKPGSSKATVEVEITPNLQVESDVRSNAGVGAGIKWKWDY